jgi:excisionase family DNA binding protein
VLHRPTKELLANVVEAARRLGIGGSKLYELIGAGEIESVHVGKSRRAVVAASARSRDRLAQARERTVSD